MDGGDDQDDDMVPGEHMPPPPQPQPRRGNPNLNKKKRRKFTNSLKGPKGCDQKVSTFDYDTHRPDLAGGSADINRRTRSILDPNPMVAYDGTAKSPPKKKLKEMVTKTKGVVAMLQKQVDGKDKQLKRKAKQISDTSEVVRETKKRARRDRKEVNKLKNEMVKLAASKDEEKEKELAAVSRKNEKAMAKMEEDMEKAESQKYLDMAAQDKKHDKRLTAAGRMHQKEMAASAKRHSAEIAVKDKKILESDIKLKKSQEEYHAALRMIQELQMKMRSQKDDFQIFHKEEIKDLQRKHAGQLEERKEKLAKKQRKVAELNSEICMLEREKRASRKLERRANERADDADMLASSRLSNYNNVKQQYDELKDAVVDDQHQINELEDKVNDLGMIAKDCEKRDGKYQDIIAALKPRLIKKGRRWSGGRGGNEWEPHVDMLILEMLNNRTHPTCIQANIYAVCKVICPNMDIVAELPSVKYIRDMRVVNARITKTLAAYRIAQFPKLKQIHFDGTSRRQREVLNVVVSAFDEDDTLKTICLDGCIIAENKTAPVQASAIIETFANSSKFLQDWKDETEELYRDSEDLSELLNDIPDPNDLSITKIFGGGIMSDNCNPANATQTCLEEMIMQIGKARGYTDEEMIIYQCNCSNHARCTVMDKVTTYSGSRLSALLKEDLDKIPPHLRISCKMDDILYQVDKCSADTANYFKGSGEDYTEYKGTFHPTERLLPKIRVTGGTRQDSAFEGALPAFDDHHILLAFLDGRIAAGGENILEECLCLILESVEMIAQLRVFSILFLSLVVPWRWLAGNTHKLAHRNWGERSMSRVINIIHNFAKELLADGSKLLDDEFMLKIFSPLYEELPEFESYMTYYLEEKECNTMASTAKEDRVLGIDLACAELFFPQRDANRQTTDLCKDLATGIAAIIITELEDTSKVLYKSLDALNGEQSWTVVPEKEKEASLGMRANNDPSEGVHATFTDQLIQGGRVGIDAAAGLGQSRYNKDTQRGNLSSLVTGRKSKKVVDSDTTADGVFHLLREELRVSLISTGKKRRKADRRRHLSQMDVQRKFKKKKIDAMNVAKLQASKDEHLQNSFLWQQWNSPRCWRTADQAREEFGRLKAKKWKVKFVKEQILIRYLGLGWDDAHHPWSKNGYTFSAEELLEHLINVVIPLENTEVVPDRPPINLPTRARPYKVGTLSNDAKRLDNSRLDVEEQLRLEAATERDRLEASGVGDQLNEMQEASWPWQKIKKGFKIDVLFIRSDEGDDYPMWSQGVVDKLICKSVSEESSFVKVDIKWNADCVMEGEAEVTREKLLKSKYNLETHTRGVWRQDLHHKVLDASDLVNPN